MSRKSDQKEQGDNTSFIADADITDAAQKAVLHISRATLSSETGEVTFSGWVEGASIIRELVVTVAGTSVVVDINVHRPDVLKQHAHLTDSLCGFETRFFVDLKVALQDEIAIFTTVAGTSEQKKRIKLKPVQRTKFGREKQIRLITNDKIEESLNVSQFFYSHADKRLSLTGWLKDPGTISRIEVNHDGEVFSVNLHQLRPDLSERFGDARYMFAGYSLHLMMPGEPTSSVLLVYDLNGNLGHVMPLESSMKIEAAKTVSTASCLSSYFHQPSQTLCILIASKLTETINRISLTQSDGKEVTFPLNKVEKNKFKKLFKEVSSEIQLYALQAVVRFDPTSDSMSYALWTDEKRINISMPITTLEASAHASEVMETHIYPLSKAVKVSGFCPSPACTLVQVYMAGKYVGSSATYLDPNAKSYAEMRSSFIFETLVDDVSVKEVELKFYVGNILIEEMKAALRNQPDGYHKVGGLPLQPAKGVSVYRFDTHDEKVEGQADDRPWVVYYSGLEAWPPVSGGTARTHALCRHLRRSGYRIALIANEQSGQRHDVVSNLDDVCDALIMMPNLMGTRHKASRPDARLHDRANPILSQVLANVSAVFDPQAVIVNFVYNLRGLQGFGFPIILDAHDIQHLRSSSASSRNGAMADRWCSYLEERSLLTNCDRILAIQDDEATILQEMAPQTPTVTVGHTLDVQEASLSGVGDKLKNLFFVGQKYQPNIEGLKAFLEKSWPKLIKKYPDIILNVVGKVCEAFKDNKAERVVWHGVVDRLEPHFEQAGILINPTPYGTGFKIKSLEGLAFGRCVVATPQGALGLPKDAPLIIRELEAFSDAISDLIDNPKKAVSIAENGSKFVREKYSADTVYAPLVEILSGYSDDSIENNTDKRLKNNWSLAEYAIADTSLMVRLRRPAKHIEKTEHFISDTVDISLLFGGQKILTYWVSCPPDVEQFTAHIPLSKWMFDGHPRNVELELGSNGRIVPLRLQAVANIDSSNRYAMENWAYKRLGSNESVEFISYLNQSYKSGVSDDDTAVKIVFNGSNVGGLAIEPSTQNTTHRDARLFLSPKAMTLPTASRSVLHNAQTTGVEAVLTTDDINRLRWKHEIAEPTYQSVFSAKHAKWLKTWPLAIRRGSSLSLKQRYLASNWNDKSTSEQTHLQSALRSTDRVKVVRLVFDANSDDADVLRWMPRMSGNPLHLVGMDTDLKTGEKILSFSVAALVIGAIIDFDIFYAPLHFNGVNAPAAASMPMIIRFD